MRPEWLQLMEQLTLGGLKGQANQTWLSLKAQIWKLDLAKSNFQNYNE